VEPVRRIADQPSGTSSEQMIAYLCQFEELGWALDERQRARALELGPDLFEDDHAAWAMVRAHLYWLRGDKAKARQWADSASAKYEEESRTAPDDPQRRAIHGVALAYLGRYPEAIQEGKRALEALSPAKDMYFGPYIQHQLVRIYLLAGQPDQALDLLEPLLAMPYTLTPAWLRIDPLFEPLRDHPRFKRLVEGTA
jgi:tetratricopeptide (TPR) repeat protein